MNDRLDSRFDAIDRHLDAIDRRMMVTAWLCGIALGEMIAALLLLIYIADKAGVGFF
jgi:hypothetical protein